MQFPLSLTLSINLPLALSHCMLMCIIELFPQLYKHVLGIGHVPISYSNNVYKLNVLRIGESCECSVNSNNSNKILSQLTSQMERTSTRSYSHTHTQAQTDKANTHTKHSRDLDSALSLVLLLSLSCPIYDFNLPRSLSFSLSLSLSLRS